MSKIVLAGINSQYVHLNLAVRYLKKYVEANSDLKIEIYETNINKKAVKIESLKPPIFNSFYFMKYETIFLKNLLLQLFSLPLL